MGTHAQNIPNGDFEDWGFRSSQELQDWTTTGNVALTTDAYTGTKAIRFDNIAKTKSSGFISTGPYIDKNFEKIPYDEQPLSVRFRCKFDLAIGEQAQVASLFYLKGNAIGYQNTLIEGNSADTFQYFSLPITWSISTNPDSVSIVISSKNLGNDQFDGDGYMIVDDFHFASISTRNKALPNGDFEDWNEVKRPHLNSWFTTDEYLFDLFGLEFATPFVQKSTNGRSGSDALELTNQEFGGDIVGGIAFTGARVDDLEKPTFSISNRWKFFEGYYQYSPVNGDTTFIAAILYKNGAVIGSAEFKTDKATTEYTYFALEIDYYTTDIPDSASIILSSCNPDEPRGIGTTLLIDGLQFSDYNAGIFNLSLNKLTVYPNPFSDRIYLSGVEQMIGAQYTLVDVLGNTVKEGILDRNRTIHIAHSLPGVYILHLNGKHVNTSKILVRE